VEETCMELDQRDIDDEEQRLEVVDFEN
jgi:hypothetical protein